MIFICWGYYIRKSFPFQLFFPPPYIKQQQRVTYCTSYPPPFAWSIHAAFISILIAWRVSDRAQTSWYTQTLSVALLFCFCFFKFQCNRGNTFCFVF
jgi:hypothetical protein